MPNLDQILTQVKELPSLPEIYIKVSDLLDKDESSAQEIGIAVQADISITSRILKMVNSAYYGLQRPVASVPQAVSLLGAQQLKHILIGSVLEGLFKNIDNIEFSMEEFWRHSIKTAIIGRHLAMQNAYIIDHEALFTAGLLHDIGQLVIAGQMPGYRIEIERLRATKGISFVEAETEVLGFSHTDVSEALMRKWGLPELLIHCAGNHHKLIHEGPYADASSIVYLANALSQHHAPEDEEEAQYILSDIPNWEQTKCTLDQICVAWRLAEEQVFEVMESFGMVNIDIADD